VFRSDTVLQISRGSDLTEHCLLATMSTTTRLHSTILGTFRASTVRTAPAFKQRCAYHSYDYAQPPPFPPAEAKILSSAYAHVPNHGFTIDSLKLGARDAGYLDASTNLFPRGVFDLINYHLVMQRLALKESVQFPDEKDGKRIGVGSKVRSLTLARLRANEPVLHRWQEVCISQSIHSTELGAD
jgi:ubiquinone biosynthesis protein COQ9